MKSSEKERNETTVMYNKRWKVSVQSRKGERHKKQLLECQDQYDYQLRESEISMALVDGIGTTDINSMAGKRVARLLSDFLVEYKKEIKNTQPDEIAYNLMLRVQRLIDDMSMEYDVDRKELSSTLLGFYADIEENYYIAVHLGDGVIATYDKAENTEILSEPHNGEYINQTILTTSESALGNIRIDKGTLDDMQGFLIATDGFYNTQGDQKMLEEVFRRPEKDDIMKEKKDDQTVLVLSQR